MRLYTELNRYENDLDRLQSAKEALGKTISEYRDGLTDLSSRTAVICADLRQIQQEIKRGPRIQRHRIEDHFGEDKRKELAHFVDVLEYSTEPNRSLGDTLRYNSSDREYRLRLVNKGFVLNCKNNIYMFTGLFQSFMMAMGLTIGWGVGSSLQGIASYLNNPWYFSKPAMALTYGIIGEAMAGMTILPMGKNPFERVASDLENRAKYIDTKIRELL